MIILRTTTRRVWIVRSALQQSLRQETRPRSRSGGNETAAAGVGRVTGFYLNGGVLDTKQSVQFTLDPREEGVITDRLGYHEVGSERRLGGAYTPDVQVMDIDHLRQAR